MCIARLCTCVVLMTCRAEQSPGPCERTVTPTGPLLGWAC